MKQTTQISAHISNSTKTRLDRHLRGSGTTQAWVVEQALLHHLQALEELPADVITPVRLVLGEESARMVRDLVARPPEPTEEMRRLFHDR